MDGSTVHILVIEDEEAHAELIERTFAAATGRFHLTLVNSLQEARACMAQTQPDLVIADLILPDGQGIELLPTLGEQSTENDLPAFPMVLMTSFGNEKVAVEAIKAGALDYVVKSVTTLADLPHIAERALREWSHIAERKRAEEEIRQRNRELTLLNRVIAAATSTLDAEHVLQVVCRELAHAFELPQAAAALLDGGGAEANVVAEYLAPGRPSGLGRTIPVVGNRAMEYVLEHKKPLAVTDAQTDGRSATVHDLMRKRGTVSLLIVPLIVRGQAIGTIGLDAIERREFSEKEITLAQNVASAVGQALDTAQLHQALQRHAKRLETQHEIDRAILAAQSSQAIAQAALSHLQQLVPCQRANVVLFDFQAAQAIVLATHVNGQTSTGPERPLPLTVFSPDRDLQEGKTFVVKDTLTLAKPPAMIQKLRAEGLRSYISVPFIAQNQLIGVLDLAANRPGAFAPENIEIAREVANQLAVAIRQARLLEEEQRHAAELARALEQQREMDRLQREFIQNVSHELRTPLSIVRGYAELLENGELGELSPSQQEPVGIISRRARMLTKLVDDIVAILQVEMQTSRREPVDMAELAHALVSEFQDTAKQAGLSLIAETAPGLPSVSGDPIGLRRVLDNLISNACKFTSTGGAVMVRVQQQENSIVLQVADTGIGIMPDQLGRIFERFYQVDGSVTRRYGGVGLGLALARELVVAHGGQILVESEVGHGSTFTVILPINTQPG